MALEQKLLNRWLWFQRLCRVRRARLNGAIVGERALFGAHIDIRPGFRDGRSGRIVIGDDAWIEQGVSLCAFGGSIELARRVFIGPYAVVYGHGGVSIGEETLVSMHCCILSSEHAVPGKGELIRHQPDAVSPTRIGRDVWLGAGVKVLAGVTIGDGCVVGAGAVVTRNLDPYSIALGVPARSVRSRM